LGPRSVIRSPSKERHRSAFARRCQRTARSTGRIASQFPGPLPLQPAGDAEAIGAGPHRGPSRALRRHPGHEIRKSLQHSQGLLKIRRRQPQLRGAEQQQAGRKVVLDAGPVGLAVPVGPPVALVGVGVAAQALPTGRRDPPAALIGPCGRRSFPPALAGFPQANPQPLAAQFPGADQAGELRPHHHSIDKGVLFIAAGGIASCFLGGCGQEKPEGLGYGP
jgi:hypothetical protein